MSILSSLKKTFLPDAQTAAARRKKVFGTESKTAAAVGVGVAAAVTYAAPILAVGAVTKKIPQAVGSKVIQKAATSAGKYVLGVVKRNPVKTTVLGIPASMAVIGTVQRDPYAPTKAAASYVTFNNNVRELAKDPSLANVEKLYSEDPLLSTVVAAGGAYVVGKGGAQLYSAYQNYSTQKGLKETQEQIQDLVSSLPASNSPQNEPPTAAGKETVLPSGGTSATSPVLPATQALSTVRSGSPARRRKRKPQVQQQRQSMRVQIINAKYIRGYSS